MRTMKKAIAMLLALVMVMTITPISAIAEDNALNYLWYEIHGDEVWITGHKNNPVNLVIPSEIEGKPVTRLDGDDATGEYGAFYGCGSLQSITIPESVTYISSSAFRRCNSLNNITISNPETIFISYTFSETAYYKNEANWENGVLYIGNHLIDAKNDISGDYEIKNGTKTIASSAFNDCSALESITIPDSVMIIGNWAFGGCSSLQSITIPDSVTSIGDYAFYDCSSLQSITISDSVTSIGESAFYDCSSLKEVHISSIAAWCNISYKSDYYNFGNPLCNGAKLYLNNELVENLVIPNGVTEIKEYAFNFCSSLESITIPGSVKTIKRLFTNNYNNLNSTLKNVVIGNGTETISASAFNGCSAIESITIPASVEYIGASAFANCSQLTDVYFENDDIFTIADSYVFPRGVTFHGYTGGTAEAFAKVFGYKFVAMDGEPTTVPEEPTTLPEEPTTLPEEPTTLPEEPTTAPEENEPTIKNSLIDMLNAIKAFFTALTNFFKRLFSFSR